MGVGRANNNGVRGRGRGDVVDIPPGAGEKPFVFAPWDRLSDTRPDHLEKIPPLAE